MQGLSSSRPGLPDRVWLDDVEVRRDSNEIVVGGTVVRLKPKVMQVLQCLISADGAVVTKSVPPRSLVIGVPGQIQPLPPELDRPNHRQLTIQPLDLWHPLMPDINAVNWPSDWAME